MKWILESSLARSIMLGLLVFMLPVMVFSLLMNSRSIETSRTEIINSYQNSIDVLQKQLDDRVEMLVNAVDYMFTDSDILYLNYREIDDANQLLKYAALVENLKFYSNASLLNGDIKVFLKNKGKCFSSVNGFDNINEDDQKNVLDLDVKYTGRWRLIKGSLVFIRNPAFRRESKGIVAMASINKSEVDKFIKNINISGHEGSLFIIDGDENCVFSRANSEIDRNGLLKKISSLDKEASQFVFINGKQKYRIIYEKSQSTGLTIGMYFSENYAMRKLAGTGQLMVAFSITAVLLALLFTWIVYSKLLRPFHLLVDGMIKVGKGEFNTRIDFIPTKDFGFVFTQFNRMVGDTEKLINEVYLARLNQQNTQLKLLQSRINPHFLYNCLNFIYQMSMGEDNEGAAKMASYLGKYFRFIAKSSRETISLQEECDNITTLLEIQSMRFRGKILFKIELQESIKNLLVPSLIIQPIVENCIIHGIKQLPGEIFIHIITVVDKDKLMIIVEDDGNGISEEKLEEIRNNFNVFDGNGMGLGINNTHWRLKLKYGEKSGVKIENIKSGGVRVTLNIENIKGVGENI